MGWRMNFPLLWNPAYANDKRIVNIKIFAAASAALVWVGYSSWEMMKLMNMSSVSTIITAPSFIFNSDTDGPEPHGSVHGFASSLHSRSVHTHSVRPVDVSLQPFWQESDEFDTFLQPRLYANFLSDPGSRPTPTNTSKYNCHIINYLLN